MNKSQSDADIKRLTAAVTDIAVISYSALGEIAAIVKLLLLWLETQEAYRDPETIIRALDNIIYTAQNTIETVEHEAEAVGLMIISTWILKDASERRKNTVTP